MKIKNCRICNSKKLKIILKYSKVALSGSFIKKNQIKNEKKYPLNLIICQSCKHTQIDYLVNQKRMYLFHPQSHRQGIYLVLLVVLKRFIQ